MADNKVLEIEVKFKAAQTRDEIRALKKELDKFYGGLNQGTSEEIRARNLLVAIKEKETAIGRQLYTQNAKMKEQYFQLGHSLRQSRFAAIQMAESLGFDKTGVGGVLMSLAGSGGIMAGFVSAGAYVIKSMHDQAQAATLASLKADKYKEKLKEIRGELTKRGTARNAMEEAEFALMSPGQQLSTLRGRVSAYESKAQPSMSSLTVLGKEAFYLERTQYLQDKKAILDIEKQITEEKKRQAEFSGREYQDMRSQFSGIQKSLQKSGFRNDIGSHLGIDLPKMDEVVGPDMRGIGKGSLDAQRSMEAIKNGAIEAGQAISQYIGGALRASLNEGENLALTIFGIAIKTALIASGSGAYAGLVPFANGGMIMEPVVGRGVRSGMAYSFAENGPEYVDPMRESRQRRTSGGVQLVRVYGELQGNGANIRATVVDIGGQRKSLRRW